jgi:hypothetical protein
LCITGVSLPTIGAASRFAGNARRDVSDCCHGQAGDARLT